MTGYCYQMIAKWRWERTTPVELGKRFLRTAERLMEAVPEIGELRIADMANLEKRALFSIAEARARISQFVEDSVVTFDGVPQPDAGYHMMGVNHATDTPRQILWSAKVGGDDGDDLGFHVGLLFESPDPAVATYQLYRAALLTIIEDWPSHWANASAYDPKRRGLATAPGVPPHPSSRFGMPWISYLSAPLAAGLVPPPDVPTERTADGGLLMVATDEFLDPANPDHMRRSRQIAEIMIDRVPKELL